MSCTNDNINCFRSRQNEKKMAFKIKVFSLKETEPRQIESFDFLLLMDEKLLSKSV